MRSKFFRRFLIIGRVTSIIFWLRLYGTSLVFEADQTTICFRVPKARKSKSPEGGMKFDKVFARDQEMRRKSESRLANHYLAVSLREYTVDSRLWRVSYCLYDKRFHSCHQFSSSLTGSPSFLARLLTSGGVMALLSFLNSALFFQPRSRMARRDNRKGNTP